MEISLGLQAEYQHQGEVGSELRFNHDECGDLKERLYVKRVARGWLYHCHNCYSPGDRNTHGFCRDSGTPAPSQTLELYRKLTKDEVVPENKPLLLPSDFSTDIPAKGLVWLTQYGITTEEIKEFRFGFSKQMNRLILPVYDGDTLVYWQGRNLGVVDKDNPKYINVRTGGRDVYFNHTIVNSSSIVIVEDILSAIRVGKSLPAVALLGSYIPDSIRELLKPYSKVLIWLDPDKISTAYKYATKLAPVTGKQFRVVLGSKDPKEYSDGEIKEKLGVDH